MKNITFFLVVLVSAVQFAFTGPGKNATTYKVDPALTTLVWTGKKVTGAHTGNVKVTQGNIILDGKTVKGGSFDIDMNSITCTDLTDAGYNAKLIGHLKNEDFFAVDKFPKASFVASSITSKGGDNYDVTGKLTIKGIAKDITFPAVIKTNGKVVTADAKIKVDRTKYDIKYGSGSFFDNLGDKTIEDNFEIDLKLVANK
ncbi:MAG TPA: YceI family protein [Cytophagaceae bacterium]